MSVLVRVLVSKLNLIPEWIMPGLIGMFRDGWSLSSWKPQVYIPIMLLNPFIHAPSHFANVYLYTTLFCCAAGIAISPVVELSTLLNAAAIMLSIGALTSACTFLIQLVWSAISPVRILLLTCEGKRFNKYFWMTQPKQYTVEPQEHELLRETQNSLSKQVIWVIQVRVIEVLL